MEKNTHTSEPSNGLMIASFLFFAVCLWAFTDTGTALVGTLFIGLGYANYFTDEAH
jgi:hypothetical protein